MRFKQVTCPHCGLLCDDLTVDADGASLKLIGKSNPACAKAYDDASFTSARLPAAKIAGKKASLDAAIRKSAKLLQASSQPLVSGLIADVQACRNAVLLTEKIGGVIDHASGAGMRPNNTVMQRHGKVKTTLSEVRNRADLVIILGSQIFNQFPRLADRVLFPRTSLGGSKTTNKEIIVIDSANDSKGNIPRRKGISYLRLEADSLEEIIQRFQLAVTDHTNSADKHDQADDINNLVSKLLAAHYSTIIWNSGLLNPASAEQSIQSITLAIKSLMKDVRCVGLPLGGSKGEITANQVITWQMGVPLPVSFASEVPEHQPLLYCGQSMLDNNEADLLLWVSTYSPEHVPPKTKARVILIGHPKMKVPGHVDVYIPVGIPGIDHTGLACRTDSVATLPLRKLRDINLPAASDVLKQITELV
jgi:formylmethanofuran dehydrogenase subunit B